MTNDAKNVLNQTNELIAKADFEGAAKICKDFLAKNPQNLKIWWNYILADCKATDEKGLATLGVDLKSNALFNKATTVLSADKSAQLLKMEKKVESLKRTGSGNEIFNEYKRYFYQSILEVKQEIETAKQDIEKELKDNTDLFKTVGKNSAALYGNSLFGFLMLMVILAIPFLFAAAVLRFILGQTLLALMPLFACAVIIFIRVIIRLVKQKRFAAEYGKIKETCELTEESLYEQYSEIRKLKNAKSKMTKIYRKFKTDPSVSMKKAETTKKKFDAYYLGTGKKA